METFWMIWNPLRNIPKYQHETWNSAVNEAEKLARINPGETFIILESKSFCKTEQVPVKWEDTILIPF